MNAKKHFQKHYSKLRWEAILRSFVWGLIIGLGCCFVSLAVLWFTSLNGIFWSTVALVAVTILLAVILYFAKFRPTVKGSAKRIDSLGLEERLVTMVELQNENSLIANLQREDAKRALADVKPSAIRFNFPKKALILLCIVGALTAAMLTVTILSMAGVIPSGEEIIDAAEEEAQEVYISVTYEVEDGGYIVGEADQLILAGTRPEPVRAEAEEGYVFVEWDDGYDSPDRADGIITNDVIFVAIFEPIEEEGEDGDEGEDEPEDKPNEDAEQSDSGSPSDTDEPSGSAGGKHEEKNQIINNEVYYRERLEEFKEKLIKRLEEEGDSLTDEERAIIEAYIGIV